MVGGALEGDDGDSAIQDIPECPWDYFVFGSVPEPKTTKNRVHIDVATDDDGAMTEVVHAAAGLARPGDTVLLAPAAASYDMFSGYAARGDAFAAAARALDPDSSA